MISWESKGTPSMLQFAQEISGFFRDFFLTKNRCVPENHRRYEGLIFSEKDGIWGVPLDSDDDREGNNITPCLSNNPKNYSLDQSCS